MYFSQLPYTKPAHIKQDSMTLYTVRCVGLTMNIFAYVRAKRNAPHAQIERMARAKHPGYLSYRVTDIEEV